MAIALTTGVFETHMLQHLDRCWNNVELFARFFTHTVQGALAAGADLLRLRQVKFDALARQVRRQGTATALFWGRPWRIPFWVYVICMFLK